MGVSITAARSLSIVTGPDKVHSMIRPLLAVYRALIAVLLLLVVGFALLTVFTISRKEVQGKTPAPPAAGAVEVAEAKGQSFFTGIGRIRAATDDPVPATVIVSIAFPYDASDSAFSEELAARTRAFRELSADLFSSYSKGELDSLGEARIKAELIRRFNAILRLGSIGEIYFNDYIVIE